MKRGPKRASLLIAILFSGVIITIISIIGRFTIYKDYSLNYWKQPIMTVLFEGIRDGVYPWNIGEKPEKECVDAAAYDKVVYVDQDQEMTPTPTQKVENPSKKQETEKNPSEKKKTTGEKEQKKDNTKTKGSSKEKEKKEVSFSSVKQSYFDDALFIGDSRTVGFSEYSYLDNATYYCDVGLSVYSVFDRKIAKVGKKSVTLADGLKKKKFKKIYIMLGINELGTGNVKTFTKKYDEMIQEIRELQPDAIIMIQSIMCVGKDLSKKDEIFTNKNIKKRNEGLKTLADDEDIFYLDVNEAITDKSGNLPKSYSFDGIHLKAKYYDLWADYLMSHGVERE